MLDADAVFARIMDNLHHAASEAKRLKTLTNQELVAEAGNSRAADYLVVTEMMSRLDPSWSGPPGFTKG